jgi:hypothetical protein
MRVHIHDVISLADCLRRLPKQFLAIHSTLPMHFSCIVINFVLHNQVVEDH